MSSPMFSVSETSFSNQEFVKAICDELNGNNDKKYESYRIHLHYDNYEYGGFEITPFLPPGLIRIMARSQPEAKFIAMFLQYLIDGKKLEEWSDCILETFVENEYKLFSEADSSVESVKVDIKHFIDYFEVHGEFEMVEVEDQEKFNVVFDCDIDWVIHNIHRSRGSLKVNLRFK